MNRVLAAIFDSSTFVGFILEKFKNFMHASNKFPAALRAQPTTRKVAQEMLELYWIAIGSFTSLQKFVVFI